MKIIFAVIFFASFTVAKTKTVETLVPTNLQPITDSKGNQWSINNYGFIQSGGNTLYNNLSMLHLGQQQFYNYQAMSTADGSEIVLHSQQPVNGLNVIRRVKIMEKEGAVRHVDLFHNPGSSPVTTLVEYRHNFSNPYAHTLDQLGQPVDRQWGNSDQTLLTTVKNGSYKACLFVLAGAHGAVRPKIIRRTQYEIHIGYTITVAPNQTVGLASAVAQVANPLPEGDPIAAKKVTSLFSIDRLMKSIRPEDRVTLVNFSSASQEWPSLIKPLDLASTLKLSPNASDTLTIGSRTQLSGQTTGTSVQIQTLYGPMNIPFEHIVAFTGDACELFSQHHVFLHGGEVVVGKMTALDAKFRLPSESQINLSAASVDRWWRGQGTTAPVEKAATGPLVVLRDGTRLRVEAIDGPLTFQTGWGRLTIDPKDIEWMAGPSTENEGLSRLALSDGTRISGLMSASSLSVRSRWLASPVIEPPQLAAIVSESTIAKAKTKSPIVPALNLPTLTLGREQRLTGSWAEESSRFIVQGQEITVPMSSIRRLSYVETESEEKASPHQVKIELWSGGHLQGQWADSSLRWKTREHVWNVPVSDIYSYDNPQPFLTETMREQVSAALQNLGHAEWPVREKATQQLREMGPAIYPLLRSAHRTSEDMEVKNRLHLLLEADEASD